MSQRQSAINCPNQLINQSLTAGSYNMVGHLKFCLTLLGGFFLFSEHLQPVQLFGVLTTLSGKEGFGIPLQINCLSGVCYILVPVTANVSYLLVGAVIYKPIQVIELTVCCKCRYRNAAAPVC